MDQEKFLRKQLLDDLETLHGLILRYASGDRSAKRACDKLEGAIQVKLAFWRAMSSQRPGP